MPQRVSKRGNIEKSEATGSSLDRKRPGRPKSVPVQYEPGEWYAVEGKKDQVKGKDGKFHDIVPLYIAQHYGNTVLSLTITGKRFVTATRQAGNYLEDLEFLAWRPQNREDSGNPSELCEMEPTGADIHTLSEVKQARARSRALLKVLSGGRSEYASKAKPEKLTAFVARLRLSHKARLASQIDFILSQASGASTTSLQLITGTDWWMHPPAMHEQAAQLSTEDFGGQSELAGGLFAGNDSTNNADTASGLLSEADILALLANWDSNT